MKMAMTATLLATLVTLMTPVDVVAQTTARSFEELAGQELLEEGDTIRIVFDLEGRGEYREMEARNVRLTSSAITVRVDSLPRGATTLRITTPADGEGAQVEIPEARVRRIATGAGGLSRWAGALIGGGVGAGAWLGVAGLCIRENELGDGCDLSEEEGVLLGVGLVAGGATAGALLASPREGAVLFESEEPGGESPSLVVSPVLSTERKGVLLSLTW